MCHVVRRLSLGVVGGLRIRWSGRLKSLSDARTSNTAKTQRRIWHNWHVFWIFSALSDSRVSLCRARNAGVASSQECCSCQVGRHCCCLEPLAKSSRMLGEKNKIFDSFCHDASANTCFLSWLSCRCQQPDVQIHWLAWKPATEFPVGFFLMKLQVVSAFSTLSFPCLCFLLHGTRSCLLFLFKMADYGADTKMTTFSVVLTQASALCTNQGNLQCFVAVFGS